MRTDRHPRRGRATVLATTMALSLAIGAAPAQALPDRAVFVISNEVSGNQVLVYRQGANGALNLVDSVATGGLGSGSGLGSQGAVTLSDDATWLAAVNPGSDTVSVFSVDGTHLELVDTESTSGDRPVSVDIWRNLVYVVNAGSSSIAGFKLNNQGLRPIEGSTLLSGPDVGAAQIEFSPDGRALAVTEKATNTITTFDVSRSGRVSNPRSAPSAGATPFGFEFDPHGHLVVSEAFGGAAGASTVSTYQLDDSGVSVLDSAVGTTQTAACWIAISADGRHVYTTNTGSDTISRFGLAADGALTLMDQTTTGDAPIDLDLSDDGAYLYALNAASDSISIYSVQADGSLISTGTLAGIPATAVGLAAS